MVPPHAKDEYHVVVVFQRGARTTKASSIKILSGRPGINHGTHRSSCSSAARAAARGGNLSKNRNESLAVTDSELAKV
jgi:hypothetical protein